MKLLLGLILLFQSTLSFACWRLEGMFAIGARELKVNHKIEHDRIYSFALGDIYFHMQLNSTEKTDIPTLELWVEEKTDRKLIELTRERIQVNLNEEINKRIEKNDLTLLWRLKVKDI